jgi:murein DD-endopeptidase MepM/ murein hydrolase activator NlpD
MPEAGQNAREGRNMLERVDQRRKICTVAILISVLSAAFMLIFFLEFSRARNYVVKRGDHLVKLEKRFGIPWQEIKKINGLAGTTIYPGQQLIIPELAVRNYLVRKGDSLVDLGRKFGIPWQEIKKINGLAGTTIYPGQQLIIPLKGVWHVVKEHQWLLLIARTYGKTYGVSKEEIIEANRLTNPDNLVPGQKLFIPRAKRELKIKIPPEVLTRDVTALPPPASTGESKKTPDYLLSEKKVLSQPAPLDIPEKKLSFLWPVEGEVIGYFGDKGNKGIDIAASEGTTIVAPADGVVELAGYDKDLGNLLMIKHKKEELITVYTYLSSSLVGSGSKVKKGDPIARVGITGTAKIPCLHFEVRKIGTVEPVNPLDYLP